ncbi:MAG: CorA family divalent cation transporter [Sulfolobales archaeon]
MKCNIPYSELQKDFPKSEVDVYRVLEVDNTYYIRLELDGKPHYLTLTENGVILHSKFLHDRISKEDLPSCNVKDVLDEIFYIMIYELGIRRTQLFTEFDRLFDLITSGKLRDARRIIELRRRIIINYSDSTVLFYISRRLSRLLYPETLEDVKFTYERSELLVTRSSDLYNIYLTEVQNELNEVIKKLTSISFIFMPITAVASVYAVDFSSIDKPLLNWSSLIYLTPIIFITILLVFYLRKLKWL